MFKTFARFFVVAALMLPVAALAEPIKLKLSLFTSDRSQSYLHQVKPFVDAVNAEAEGLLEIEVYFSGALGKFQAQQPQLVLDGVADIALVIHGQSPDRFRDSTVIELPGLFRGVREATLVYNQVIAANAGEDFKDFFVIGAFTSEPNSIHSRKRIAGLADLKGTKIRVNNLAEAAALGRLGAVPVVLALPQILDAISSGSIDGTTLSPSVLFDFGITRVVTNHYMLHMSAASFSLVMNRKKFESLPEPARAIIEKYSGKWIAARYIEGREAFDRQAFERIKSDSRRTVVVPSAADRKTAQHAFASVIEEWTATSARRGQLFKLVETELAKIRSAQ